MTPNENDLPPLDDSIIRLRFVETANKLFKEFPRLTATAFLFVMDGEEGGIALRHRDDAAADVVMAKMAGQSLQFVHWLVEQMEKIAEERIRRLHEVGKSVVAEGERYADTIRKAGEQKPE